MLKFNGNKNELLIRCSCGSITELSKKIKYNNAHTISVLNSKRKLTFQFVMSCEKLAKRNNETVLDLFNIERE